MNKKQKQSIKAMCEELSAVLGLTVLGISQTMTRTKAVWTLSVSDSLEVLYGPRFGQIAAPRQEFTAPVPSAPSVLLREGPDLPEWWSKFLALYGKELSDQGNFFYGVIGFWVGRGSKVEIVIERPAVWETVAPPPMPLPERVSDYTLRLLRNIAAGQHLFVRHRHHVVSMYLSQTGMWSDETPINQELFLHDLSREVDAGYMVEGHYVPLADSVRQFAYVSCQNVYSGEDCVIDEYVLNDDGRAFLERMKG